MIQSSDVIKIILLHFRYINNCAISISLGIKSFCIWRITSARPVRRTVRRRNCSKLFACRDRDIGNADTSPGTLQCHCTNRMSHVTGMSLVTQHSSAIGTRACHIFLWGRAGHFRAWGTSLLGSSWEKFWLSMLKKMQYYS